MTGPVILELSRPVTLDRLPARFTVEASVEECAALARRLRIPAVQAVRCRFALRSQGAVIEAQGALEAEVVQECIVSLEPISQRVEERFIIRFVPEGRVSENEDPEAPDEIPYQGNSIDLGEAVAEQLALGLDPYPRDPHAALDGRALEDDPGAFAALAAMQGLPRRAN